MLGPCGRSGSVKLTDDEGLVTYSLDLSAAGIDGAPAVYLEDPITGGTYYLGRAAQKDGGYKLSGSLDIKKLERAGIGFWSCGCVCVSGSGQTLRWGLPGTKDEKEASKEQEPGEACAGKDDEGAEEAPTAVPPNEPEAPPCACETAGGEQGGPGPAENAPSRGCPDEGETAGGAPDGAEDGETQPEKGAREETQRRGRNAAGGLVPFAEYMGEDFSLLWDCVDFMSTSVPEPVFARLFSNRGTLQAIMEAGGFYEGRPKDRADVLVIAVPAPLEDFPMPFLEHADKVAYVPGAQGPRHGCFTLALNTRGERIYGVALDPEGGAVLF